MKPLTLTFDVCDIRPIQLIEQLKEKIDKAWRNAFNHILQEELAAIRIEYQAIKSAKDAVSLLQLKQLRDKMYHTKENIANVLRSELTVKSRSKIMMFILNEIYNALRRDNILMQIDQDIERYEEVQSLPMTPQVAREIQITFWYAALIDAPWKRALLCGLIVALSVVIALSFWGLIAELALAAVITATGGGLGFTAILASSITFGCGSYWAATQFFQKTTPVPTPKPEVVGAGSYAKMPLSSADKNIQQAIIEPMFPQPFSWRRLFSNTAIDGPLTPRTQQIQGWEEKLAEIERRSQLSHKNS
jgi:hypothetical protein